MIRRLLDDRVYLSDLRFQYESIIHTLNDEAVNYDAINVDKVSQIPMDYDGAMGVPITYMDKWISIIRHNLRY